MPLLINKICSSFIGHESVICYDYQYQFCIDSHFKKLKSSEKVQISNEKDELFPVLNLFRNFNEFIAILFQWKSNHA